MRGRTAKRQSAVAFASLFVAGAAFGVYGHFVEPRWLRKRRLRVLAEALPAGSRGLTILHLSDFHFRKGDPISSAVIGQAADWGRSVKPDIVCITGDFIENDADIEACLDELGTLRGTYATFAVFGNHDHGKKLDVRDRDRGSFEVFVAEMVGLPWRRLARHDPPNNDIEHLRRALTNAGIHVLRNENARVSLPGGEIWVAGVDDPHQGRYDTEKAMKGIPPDAPILLLSHSHDILPELDNFRAPLLMLAGHTHGGQVRFVGLPPFITHAQVRLSDARGLLHEVGFPIHISPGLGASIPFRFGCRPEATLLLLQCACT